MFYVLLLKKCQLGVVTPVAHPLQDMIQIVHSVTAMSRFCVVRLPLGNTTRFETLELISKSSSKLQAMTADNGLSTVHSWPTMPPGKIADKKNLYQSTVRAIPSSKGTFGS